MLAVESITGVSDAVIDNDARTVAFRVQNDVDEFSLSSIVFKDGDALVYEAYADEELTQKYEGTAIPLVEGDNVFWVKGWFALAADKYAVYKFTITRTRSEQSVKSIALDAETWKSEYALNEILPQSYIIVTYADDSTEKVLLTTDMLTGFDTSAPGIKEITVTYKGCTVTASITVSEIADGQGSVSLGAWQSVYFVGEELYLDGAYLLYENGETVAKIAITPDMVTGFDTSEAGNGKVNVVYAGKTVEAEIRVYALADLEYDGVQRSTLDVDRFEANVSKIFEIFGINIYNWSAHDRDMLVDIFEYIGLTDDDVESVVGIITADDATLLDDILSAIDGQKGFADLLTENNVVTVTETLRVIKDKISAKQFVKIVSVFVRILFGSIDTVMENGLNINRDFDVVFRDGLNGFGTNRTKISAQEMLEFVNGSDEHVTAVFEEFISQNAADNYSQSGDIEKILAMDETAYIAGALLDSISAACNYDAQKIYDMVALAKKVVEAVTEGDLEKLLGGTADGLSYKAMVAEINELGNLLKTLNATFAEDPLLVRYGANVLDSIFNIWSDTMIIAFDGNTILNAAFALEKVAIECLTKVDATFVAGLYLDYDDYAKEQDSVLKEQKFGYFLAKIAAFVYPVYQKLELKEKAAIDDATEMLNLIGINVNVRGIADLIEKAAAKDADDYQASELSEIADEFRKVIGGENVDTEDRLTVIPYGTVLVQAGASKEELAQAIAESAQVVFYDASLGVSLGLDDLSAYTINFDAAEEGFFTAEIIVEGAKDTVECYAYDSTTPTKFVLYRERRELEGYAFVKGQSVEVGEINAKLSFRHKETGRIISVIAASDGWTSGVDTSEAGYYMATRGYHSPIFGDVELPVPVIVVDIYNIAPDMVNDVSFTYCDILPQNSELLISADVNFAYIYYQAGLEVIVSELDNSTLGKTTFTATLGQNEFGIEYSEQLEVTVVTKEEAMTVTDSYVSVVYDEDVYSVGTTADQIYASYSISYKYYPAGNGCQSYVSELNEAYLAEQGLRIIVKDFDTSAASSISQPLTGKILLVSATDENTVFAEKEFGYYVYDPEAQPPVVKGSEEKRIWNIYLSGKTYTESEVATLGAFLGRSYEIVTEYDMDMPMILSDGNVAWLSEFAGSDMTGRGNVVLTKTGDYGQWKEYSVDFNIDYLHITLDNIRVIPDAYKDLPTAISVDYAKSTVLQSEQLTVENVLGKVTFGYGYLSRTFFGEEEKDNLSVSCDTSCTGYVKYTVSYALNGVTLKATNNVNVISLEDALDNNVFDVGYISYLFGSDNATEDALLGELSLGYRLDMGYDEFSITKLDLTMKTANEYWESNGINVWFAVRNADGEYGAFDGTVGTLRSCTLLVCSEYYGHYAEVVLFDLLYAVVDESVQNAVTIDTVYFDRNVVLEEEKNSGEWKDLVKIDYSVGDESFYDVVLGEFLNDHGDFTAELVYDYDKNCYQAVVTGPYTYYRYDNVTVIPDNEANKLTAVFVSDCLTYIASDAEPVAGVHYKLTAEYGYGYKNVEITDNSGVIVRLVDENSYYRWYEISYGEFSDTVRYELIEDLQVEIDIEAMQYDRNCSVDEVALFGNIIVIINNERAGSVFAYDTSIAEVNLDLGQYGLTLSLKDFDPALSHYEQREVTVVVGDFESQVMAFERGKTIVNSILLESACYFEHEGPELAEYTAEVYISYIAKDGHIHIEERQYFYRNDINEINDRFAQFNCVFEQSELDSSLPAEGQTVYLQCGPCVSDGVVLEMIVI